MRALLPALGCLGIVAFASTASAGDQLSPSAAILQSCVAATSNKSLKGLDQFKQDCPDLESALRDLGYGEQLGEKWEKRITRGALMGIVHLTSRFAGEPQGAGPDVAALAAAMQSLTVHDAPQSWWERFKSWLRSWLRSPEARSADNDWLRRLLARINLPPTVARAIGYLTIAVLLSLSLWVVLRELRVTGALARSPGRETPPTTGRPRTAAAGTVTDMAAVQTLPHWQQPAALLAVLVQALRQSGRLSAERALTHRELVECAVLDEGSQRARFRRVAQLAERQLYGAHAPGAANAPEPELLQVLGEGMSLHSELAVARSGRG